MLGGILHVGDGSDTNGGTGVIATEMVTGEGDAGYALQIANTNATNWGGLLMFYFPYERHDACMPERAAAIAAWSFRSGAPLRRAGSASTSACSTRSRSPTTGSATTRPPATARTPTSRCTLPADAATWLQVQVPWSAFTPGVGSATSCVPVTGQNIVRLVIQPFMSYPPPDYMFEPGAYAIAVDNVRFY